MGATYYRLKQIDLGGAVHYTDPVQVAGVTGVTEGQRPSSYDLGQAYPNPFNPSTRIRYAVPEAARVRIGVYNQLGQQVRTLVNEFQEAGMYEITLNADGLPSGVYVYRMESGMFVDARKVVLLR
ncbi:MAG: T9SS type A sorting domain-containing protein [Ignavibacteriae bacterium]|nr:T9SS type A sorting domain-containing protein [Ignavibacteriota bacterium]